MYTKKEINARYYQKHREKLVAQKAEYYEQNRDKAVKCSTASRRKRKYGVTAEQYQKMWEEQKGLCYICGKPETTVDKQLGKVKDLAVDHNHKTNKIRKLLCQSCNTALGLFGDSIELLQKVICYLNEEGIGYGTISKAEA